MAFDWANVIVAPTGSTGLDSGDHTSVDEAPPWSDADTAQESVAGSASETAIFSGFDLSLAGGEKEGFHIWSRMSSSTTTGFDVTIVLKQDTTTLWTSSTFTVAHTAYNTYVIPVPNSAFVGSDIDNLSLEFTVDNLSGSTQSFRWSWLRISKSPFTTAQKATLPSTLAGQDFVCYRASDLAVLGAADAESVVLIPDSSGNGKHTILLVGTAATYETDAPAGILTSNTRYGGCLGFDPATEAPIRWTNNNIFHAKVYPTTLTTDHVIFSNAASGNFAGSGSVGDKNLMGVTGANDWVLMSGDGTGPAHLAGGSPVINTEFRLTEWIQISAGNEHMWENDDASPIIDGSSGDNPFSFWSLLNRETDNRPWIGRFMEVWFVEGTGITEGEIDTARDEWVAGITSIIELDSTPAGSSTAASNLTQINALRV